MITVYGINNCGSVKKAREFLESQGVKYRFVDMKKQAPSLDKITQWLESIPLATLLNTKGTTYKQLGLKGKHLSLSATKQLLEEFPTLIKRPVIENTDGRVIVGFDAELYQTIWGL